jgi:hypothetical protein
MTSICCSAREVAGLHGAALLEAREVLVDALDPPGDLAPVGLGVGARDQVLLGGEVLEDAPALEDLHDSTLHHLVGGQPVDAIAVELHRALGDLAPLGAEQTRDRLQGGGLAGAVGAQQRGDAPLRAGDGHALEDEDYAVVDDLDVVEAQHRDVAPEGARAPSGASPFSAATWPPRP